MTALCDITGQSLDELKYVARHTRDMWELATKEAVGFYQTELAVGSLLVTKRVFLFDGEEKTIPGHIGVVTDLNNLSFVHASASAGRVEERPLFTKDTILGSIAVDL